MIPDLDLARVHKWIDQRNVDMPPRARDEIRYEVDVTDRTVTGLECRLPWREDFGPEWSRFPICRFRYTKVGKEWSLYCACRLSVIAHSATGTSGSTRTTSSLPRHTSR